MISKVLFFAVFGFCNAQILYDLKTLKGDNVVNVIYNGQTSIYVTASTDSKELLRQIYFVSSDNDIKSAYDLTQQRLFQNNDEQKPWVVTGETKVKTVLNAQQLSTLAGTIYCTTAKQSLTPNFFVYDVSQVQKLTINPGTFGDYTLVFLNSWFVGNPMRPTTFTGWNQAKEVSVSMYQGLPTDTEEKDSSIIFSNPMIVGNKPNFFAHVDDFSMTLGAFYLKVNGTDSFQFSTSPQYKQPNGSQMKGYTATGFYMKSNIDSEQVVRITPITDPSHHRTLAVNSIAQIPDSGRVYFYTFTGSTNPGTNLTNSNTIQSWQSNTVGSALIISPKGTVGGQFFLQFCTIQGDLIDVPTTSPSLGVTTTPKNIQTTTSSAYSSKFLLSFIVVILSVLCSKLSF